MISAQVDIGRDETGMTVEESLAEVQQSLLTSGDTSLTSLGLEEIINIDPEILSSTDRNALGQFVLDHASSPESWEPEHYVQRITLFSRLFPVMSAEQRNDLMNNSRWYVESPELLSQYFATIRTLLQEGEPVLYPGEAGELYAALRNLFIRNKVDGMLLDEAIALVGAIGSQWSEEDLLFALPILSDVVLAIGSKQHVSALRKEVEQVLEAL